MEQELSSIRDRFQQVNQKLIECEKAFESLKKENDEIIIERDRLLAELQVLLLFQFKLITFKKILISLSYFIF
jgi:hypothetical protein